MNKPIQVTKITFATDAIKELIKQRGYEDAVRAVTGDQFNEEYIRKVFLGVLINE